MKLIFLIIILTSSVWAEDCVQKISKGDTISGLLSDKKVIPLWGQKGTVKQTGQLNKKDPNIIFPNELWKMPIHYCNYVENPVDTQEEVAIEVSEVSVTQVEDDESSVSTGFEVDFLYSKLQGENAGGTGSYLSDLGKKYSMFFQWHHSKNWSTKVTGSFQTINWDNIDGFTTKNRMQQLWGARAESTYQWVNFSTAFFLGMDEQPFYKASAATQNRMEKISVGYSGVALAYDLVSTRYWVMTPGVEAAVNMVASNQGYNLKSGYRYGGFLKNSLLLNSWSVFSKVSYTDTHIKNDDLKFTFKQLGVSVGVAKEF